jgi:hypothetical protein
MQSFARMPANLLPAGDDIVVVGRISLNTKKAKRNLTKIADQNARKVMENCGHVAPTPAPRAQRNPPSAPEAPVQRTSQRTRKPRSKPAVAVGTVCAVSQVVPVDQAPAVQLLVDMPDAVLAHLFLFTDVQAVGRVATSCHTVYAVMGAQSLVWSALGGMQGLVLRASVPREAFRQALFGLEGNWFKAFSDFAASGEPQEVLQEADYLTGGMVAVDRGQAHGLAKLVAAAATRCDADLDAAAAMVLSTLKKVEARPEVFTRSSQLAVREAHLDLRERAVLARLAQDDAPTFDYFEEELAAPETTEWEDAEPVEKPLDLEPAEARDLAASFLEVMGLRHGHNAAETMEAIRALEQQ